MSDCVGHVAEIADDDFDDDGGRVHRRRAADYRLNNLVESYVASSLETAELAGQQIKHSLIIRLQEQEQRAAAEGRKESLNELLQSDRGFILLLESTMAETHSLVEISVAGQAGTIIASSNPLRPGTVMQTHPNLSELQRMSSLERLTAVLRHNTDHELRIPLGFSNQSEPVFTIQVLASSVLLREQLLPAMRRVAEWGTAGADHLSHPGVAFCQACHPQPGCDLKHNRPHTKRRGACPTSEPGLIHQRIRRHRVEAQPARASRSECC